MSNLKQKTLTRSEEDQGSPDQTARSDTPADNPTPNKNDPTHNNNPSMQVSKVKEQPEPEEKTGFKDVSTEELVRYAHARWVQEGSKYDTVFG